MKRRNATILFLLMVACLMAALLPTFVRESLAAQEGRGSFPLRVEYELETKEDENGQIVEIYHYTHPTDAENLKVRFSYAFAGWYTEEFRHPPAGFEKDLIAVTSDLSGTDESIICIFETGDVTKVATYGEDVIVPGSEFYILVSAHPANESLRFTVSSIESYTPIPEPKRHEFTIKTGESVKVYMGEETIYSDSSSIFNAEEGFEINLSADLGLASLWGLSFAGWYVDGVKVSDELTYTHTLTANCTIEARTLALEEQEFNVSFNTNGGSSAPPAQTVKYGGLVEEPPQPYKEHYTFDGWYYVYDSFYSLKWDFNSSSVAEDTVLYATYTKNTYTVTFDANGGNILGQAKRNLTVGYGELIDYFEFGSTKPNHEDFDFNFTGWYKDVACTELWDVNKDVVEGNTTLYAGWFGEPIVVTIKGGGSVQDVQINTNVGQLVDKPQDPVRKGYDFKGWYKDSACKNAWDFTQDRVSRSMDTIYAKWVAKTYTITYISNGGSKVASVKAKYDSLIPDAKKTPKKSKRVFGGWYLNKKCTKSILGRKVSGNMTLYARWAPYVKLQAVANGGKFGGKSSRTFRAGKGLEVTLPTPTRKGHVFAAWFKDKKCKRQVSIHGTLIAFKGKVYAGWLKQCTVKFNLGGGSGNFKSITVMQGNGITFKANPTRSGYIFSGWYKDRGFKTAWTAGSKVTGNMTLYAKWTKYIEPPVASFTKDPTTSKDLNWGGMGRDLAQISTKVKFNKAGRYKIEHDIRSGDNRKLYKSNIYEMKAGQEVSVGQVFVLTNKKIGSCDYYIRVLDSSGKVVLEKKVKLSWAFADIGTDMSVES